MEAATGKVDSVTGFALASADVRAIAAIYVGSDSSNMQLVLASESPGVVRAAAREMLRDVAPPADELGRARVSTLQAIATAGEAL